jgi:(S)-2-hydroxyglutarate dehydrogenase
VTYTYDFLIIGAGIVGLSVAFELKKRHPGSTICILEKEGGAGLHASGRNSGVLHSGIYYSSDTLKAKVCSEGAKMMRDFCDQYEIGIHKNGKLIIATSEGDLKALDNLLQNARENKINVEELNECEIRKIEPNASPYKKGIYSPDTAVIDSKGVVSKLRELLENLGVQFKFNSKVINADVDNRVVSTLNEKIGFGYLYNCAGAYSDQIARLFGLADKYTLIPFKGIYYKLRKEKKFLVNSNIYPVPDSKLPFLGVHLTKTIDGEVYVGPTAIPVFGRENYSFLNGIKPLESLKITSELIKLYARDKQNFRNLTHLELKKYMKSYFVLEAKKLLNQLEENDLVSTNKSGIRPQLVNLETGLLEMDYIIERNAYSTHVLNSISPAFTSAFKFSELIVNLSEN